MFTGGMGGICRTGRAAEAGIRNSADTVVDGSSGRNEGIENSDAPKIRYNLS